MILTRDNLLRFIKENKYVTPTIIGESFETTTMIASAALSELAKEKLILITYLKLSSSPYYYDPKQKDSIEELGEKHLKSYDKEIFLKLRETQIINGISLNIQENLAIERIKDFAIPLEILHNGKDMKFWLWFKRDIVETKKQIIEALDGENQNKKEELNQKNVSGLVSSKKNHEINQKKNISSNLDRMASPQTSPNNLNLGQYSNTNHHSNINHNNSHFFNSEQNNNNNANIRRDTQQSSAKKKAADKLREQQELEDQQEDFIERYFRLNGLRLENKQKKEKGIFYNTTLQLNKIEVIFDCFLFLKKPSDPDVIKFYTSSNNPKIVFSQNAPKKLYKLAATLENLTIVNI